MYCLCEAEILPTGGHGCIECLAKIFIRLVFGKVKFCGGVSNNLRTV